MTCWFGQASLATTQKQSWLQGHQKWCVSREVGPLSSSGMTWAEALWLLSKYPTSLSHLIRGNLPLFSARHRKRERLSLIHPGPKFTWYYICEPLKLGTPMPHAIINFTISHAINVRVMSWDLKQWLNPDLFLPVLVIMSEMRPSHLFQFHRTHPTSRPGWQVVCGAEESTTVSFCPPAALQYIPACKAAKGLIWGSCLKAPRSS